MDSRIHRAFPKKRYKDNKLYWQTRTAKAHRRRATYLSPLSLSVFHPDDHLPRLPSFCVYVLPLFCNHFSFSLCLRSSFYRVSNSLLLFPQFTFSHSAVISLPSLPLWLCSISIEGFQGQYLSYFLFIFFCLSLFSVKVTAREQLMLR